MQNVMEVQIRHGTATLALPGVPLKDVRFELIVILLI
jgi:hypothetical protein